MNSEEAQQPLLHSGTSDNVHIRIVADRAALLRQRGPGNIILRLLASLYLYTALPLALLGSFIVQTLAWILLFPLFLAKPRLRLICQGLIFRFFQALAAFYLNPFWRMKVVKPPPENFNPNGKVLMMCNHLTGADPYIANRAFFPWELKYVYKAELHKIPIAGQVVQLAGDLPVYFTKERGGWGTKPGAVKGLMERVLSMAEKHQIGTVVFPEGTRSRTGRLQLFKMGFFRLAIEHQFEIMPCVGHNNTALWPLGSSIFGCGTVYWIFGEVIKPQPNETPEELCERVRNAMIDLMKLSPVYDEELDAPMTEMAERRGLGVRGHGPEA